jgi:ribosomal protein S25
VYGAEALKKLAVYEWYNLFKNGQETVEDEPCCGRPSTFVNTETIEKVRQLVCADRRITLHEVANKMGISHGSTQAIVIQEL